MATTGNVPVNIVANTSQAQKQIAALSRTPVNLNIRGLNAARQPLGRIVADVSEFEKSLGAANARVVAFGASAGAVFAIESAFKSLISTFVNTEKQLSEINVLLNLSGKNLKSFGNELFNIAGKTGQSFDVVAEAAKEFSRQGLGVEETLERTQSALVLTRLSGLSAADSVNALTAAMNSFQTASLEASEIVNKFANVDASFAVSSADLANAISRVGSSADDAGVSFDELISLVTTAQQVTARGGSVIGNSFKTIFTRLGREKIVNLFESLGISTTDGSGAVKGSVQLLQDLARTYDDLSATQQNYVAEQVGGVFQINILKAALGDLGKEYSIYDRALKTSLGSTDQAIKRNEELNKSISSLANETLQNLSSGASNLGEGLFGDAIRNVLNITNLLSESVNSADSESIGSKIGGGIIDGVSNFISGPGLALLTAVFLKLFQSFTKFAGDSFKEVLGLNQASKQQAAIQQSIVALLQSEDAIYEQILNGQLTVTQAAQKYLAIIEEQTLALKTQDTIAKSIAGSIGGNIALKNIGNKTIPVTKPNASGLTPYDVMSEVAAASDAGYSSPLRPNEVRKGRLGGQPITYNTRETLIRGGAGGIIPPKSSKAYKQNKSNFDRLAGGFVPNFAEPNILRLAQQIQKEAKNAGRPMSMSAAIKAAEKRNVGGINLEDPSAGYIYASTGGRELYRGQTGDGTPFAFTSIGLRNNINFADEVDRFIGPALNELGNALFPAGKLSAGSKVFTDYLDKSSYSQTLGRLFENAVFNAIGNSTRGTAGNDAFDLKPNDLKNYQYLLSEIFSDPSGITRGDLKFNSPQNSKESVRSFVNKLAKERGVSGADFGKNAKAGGFSPLRDAIGREMAAGLAPSQIYVKRKSSLVSSSNPYGFGVFNTRDEGSASSEGKAISKKGYASGFVPNFAAENNVLTDSVAIGGALTSILFSLQFFSSGLDKETRENIRVIKKQRDGVDKAIKDLEKAISRGSPAFKAARQKELRELQSNRTSLTNQIGPSFLSRNSFGLGFTAQSLAPIIGNFIGKETTQQRGVGQSVESLGNIAGFAAAGSIAGPWGIAIGAATGAVLEIPRVVDAFTSKVPELTKAAEESRETLQKLNDASSTVLSARENLDTARSSGNSEQIRRAQEKYSKELAKLPTKLQDEVASSKTLIDAQQKLAKALEIQTKKVEADALALDFNKIGKSALRDESEAPKLLQSSSEQLVRDIVESGGDIKSLRTSLNKALFDFENASRKILDGDLSQKTSEEIESARQQILSSLQKQFNIDGEINKAEQSILDSLSGPTIMDGKVISNITSSLLTSLNQRIEQSKKNAVAEEKNVQYTNDINAKKLQLAQILQDQINSSDSLNFQRGLVGDFRSFQRETASSFGLSKNSSINAGDEVFKANLENTQKIANELVSFLDKEADLRQNFLPGGDQNANYLDLRKAILETDNLESFDRLISEVTKITGVNIKANDELKKISLSTKQAQAEAKNTSLQANFNKLTTIIGENLQRGRNFGGGIESFLSGNKELVSSIKRFTQVSTKGVSGGIGNARGLGNLVSSLNEFAGGAFLSSNSKTFNTVSRGVSDNLQSQVYKVLQSLNKVSPEISSAFKTALAEAGGVGAGGNLKEAIRKIGQLQSLSLFNVSEQQYRSLTSSYNNPALQRLSAEGADTETIKKLENILISAGQDKLLQSVNTFTVETVNQTTAIQEGNAAIVERLSKLDSVVGAITQMHADFLKYLDKNENKEATPQTTGGPVTNSVGDININTTVDVAGANASSGDIANEVSTKVRAQILNVVYAAFNQLNNNSNKAAALGVIKANQVS